MQELILETRGICKSFHRQVVLDQVSLMVPKGCVYGLLGPNGAGKTTLMKMFSGAQLMGEAESDAENLEYRGYILREAERIEDYIRMLQEMLRSQEVSCFRGEEVDLNLLIKEFTDRSNLLTAGKNQKFEITISGIPDSIYSEGRLLLRAWENLFSNAMDYTPEAGCISVSIKAKLHRLCFCIEDDGCGFTKEDLRHAIEQFYQGDKSRNSKNHYGMGLFMVQSFVDGQGGSLILENSVKQNGACVRMELDM